MWLEFSFEAMTERMGDAGVYALLGFGMVIGVLAIIWGVLSLFGLIFRIRQKRSAEDIDAVTDAGVDTVDNDENAVIAAITAAVSLVLENEAKAKGKETSGFRVVSFRRSGGDRPWVR